MKGHGIKTITWEKPTVWMFDEATGAFAETKEDEIHVASSVVLATHPKKDWI